MMKYSVEYTKRALKSLNSFDKFVRERICDWIDENLVDCENPRQYGKALTGTYKGEWSYRVGDYRIIVEIQDNRILILITAIGHRSEIYKQRRN